MRVAEGQVVRETSAHSKKIFCIAHLYRKEVFEALVAKMATKNLETIGGGDNAVILIHEGEEQPKGSGWQCTVQGQDHQSLVCPLRKALDMRTYSLYQRR